MEGVDPQPFYIDNVPSHCFLYPHGHTNDAFYGDNVQLKDGNYNCFPLCLNYVVESRVFHSYEDYLGRMKYLVKLDKHAARVSNLINANGLKIICGMALIPTMLESPLHHEDACIEGGDLQSQLPTAMAVAVGGVGVKKGDVWGLPEVAHYIKGAGSLSELFGSVESSTFILAKQ